MKHIYFLILILIFFLGCGKKQKNIFDFSEKKFFYKVNKFDLGFIKNLQTKKTSKGNELYWNFVLPKKINEKIIFLGFNIYLLIRSEIVPRNPLNKCPVKKTEFLDKEILFFTGELKQKTYYYLVRPVYVLDNKIILGLASKVACC